MTFGRRPHGGPLTSRSGKRGGRRVALADFRRTQNGGRATAAWPPGWQLSLREAYQIEFLAHGACIQGLAVPDVCSSAVPALATAETRTEFVRSGKVHPAAGVNYEMGGRRRGVSRQRPNT
jgi:hypothetical protein